MKYQTVDIAQTLLRAQSLAMCVVMLSGWNYSLTPVNAQTADSQSAPASDCAVIERSLPPLGLEIPAEQINAWMSRLSRLESQAAKLESALRTDVEVLLKACRLAIEYRELYAEKDFAKVDRLLALAQQRMTEIGAGTASWSEAAGRQVRGFRSDVDGSPQPVGLVLPQGWQAAPQPMPLYVWLHGRGDKATDLHFICERLDKDGQITPAGAIVVHPLGRQCVGYKSAGETDVMEAIDFVCENYPVDRQRIVLMGFSMGGAGVWHLAAHYGERFVAASAGAGFAETARYQGLRPENFPVKYEQILWSIYDVPGYTRNLFNLPLVAYSGELDKQIQAARVMEEAYVAQGRVLPHLIGPGMGHKYHPQTLEEIMRRMAQAAQLGQPVQPTELYIQTRHPRYSRHRWLTIDGPSEQYADTQATAVLSGNQWSIDTINVARLVIDGDHEQAPRGTVKVDGALLPVAAKAFTLLQRNDQGTWSVVEQFSTVRKQPKLSGPIDDAFIDPFLVVMPSGRSPHAAVEQWVRCESQNLAERWKMLFRGSLRTKLDSEVTPEDLAKYHVLLWGDPHSNSLMHKVMAAEQAAGVIGWSAQQVSVGGRDFQADQHVLLAIRPNPLSPGKYVVFNSGPTFRQAHDRTNSLQNPHLPDWAVVSLAVPPSAESPGKIEAAGFFGDAWGLAPELTW
jgi:predicted esterase